MKQLNLEDFKTKMSTDEIQKLDSLIGGVLGNCHCKCPEPGVEVNIPVGSSGN